jgi:hypothetical protein
MKMPREKSYALLSGFFLALLLGTGVFAHADVSAPVISDIGASALNSKSIVIRWKTNVPANSHVEYGLDESYGSRSDLDLTQVLSHAVKLTNLKPGLIYFYRVISTDSTGNRMVSQRFVFAAPAVASASAVSLGSSPTLSFTNPRQQEILKDQAVAFTYQINGDWPSADRVPHVYLWADVLQNGTWVERAYAFDIGGRTSAALRSGSFIQNFAPGTYRINGLLVAYQPNHEALRTSSVTPLVFTVWNASSTEVMASSSSLLLSSSGPKFQSGDRIRNWRAADVRQTPSKSNSLIGVQAPDTKGTIMGSPETAGGSRWWNINYDVGYDGWTHEESLLPVNAPVFDFELVAVDEGDMVAMQGSSADFSFGGRITSGSGQLVAFSARGVPGHSYGIFSPSSCTLPCLTTFHISTFRTAPVGTYPITVTAVSAKKEKKLQLKMRINKFLSVPSISLNAPFLDGVVPGSTLALSSTVLGDTDTALSRAIRFKLDDGKESITTHLNASHIFANLDTGHHVLTGYLAGDRDAKIFGTDFSLPFTTDASLPVISNLENRNITDTSNAILWNTDKNSTTRVAYDSVLDLRFSTLGDSGGLQKSHAVHLQSLIPCTNYIYRAYSQNSVGGEGMSLVNRFATSGCLTPLLPAVHAESIVSALAKSTLTLLRDDRSISAALPSGLPDTAAVQINGLDPRSIESAAPLPTSQSRLVGKHLYRILVLKNPTASIFAFDKPVMLTMRYLPEDTNDIVPGTLKIWRWTGVDWTETSQCHTNEAIREITCATNEISTFALFGTGSKLSLAPPSGSLVWITPPPNPPHNTQIINKLSETTPAAISPLSSAPQSLQKVLPQKTASAPKTSPAPAASLDSAPAARSLTRDLYRGIKNSEVKLLQQFLISRKYLDAGGNTGFFDSTTETAIKKFQCDQEIICQGTTSTTGFGSVDEQTRTQINQMLK